MWENMPFDQLQPRILPRGTMTLSPEKLFANRAIEIRTNSLRELHHISYPRRKWKDT